MLKYLPYFLILLHIDAVITYGNQIVPGNIQNNPSEGVPVMSLEAVNRIVGDVLNRQTITSCTSLAPPEFTAKPKLSVIQSPRSIHSSYIQTEPNDPAVGHKRVIHIIVALDKRSTIFPII